MAQPKQPEWIKPKVAHDAPVLKMNNSMTHSKTEFVPANGKQVNWYTCGPTVYDKSHLGHARNYITFDIIRRIMEDYFNYDVNYVMNITDIDDKIIITARSHFLFNQKKASTLVLSPELIAEVEQGWKDFVESKLGKYLIPAKDAAGFPGLVKLFEEKKGPSFTDEPKFEMWMKASIAALKAINTAKTQLAAGKGDKAAVDILLDEVRDVYASALDKALKHTVTDHAIFRDFARYWEKDYFKDMDALNVRRPDVLTRVSEYVPEIITFVEQIIKNGYAYESEGSVYFNTFHFDKDPNHFYAKLEPWSASNMKLLQEGEGDLAAGGEKKNAADFALWKASKSGEPAWDSPWGAGRPGWHIECSAMAGDVIGEKMDIHSGGSDLAFPHHDNELAQSEAHYNCKQWVNYFLHAGHLHIEGQKMSKSLKNFTSIADALEKNTAAQIRIMFLLHSWDAVLDYKQASLQEAKVFEAAINNFLLNVKSIVQESRSKPENLTGNHNFHQSEKEVYALFQQKQAQIHAALCDNFDTSSAMNALRDMITATNTYIKKNSDNPSIDVLLKVSKYVSKMMRTFGVFKDENPEIGFSAVVGEGAAGGSVEEIAGPYARLLASFRDRVRELARRKPADGLNLNSDLLQLCDKIRDEELVDLNVSLDDREEGKPALVKFIDRETILKQREEKRVAAAKAAAEKEEKKRAAAAAEAEKLAKGKVSPSEMFKDEEGKKLYSEWDDKGIPTKDTEGKEISKTGAKKLIKLWEAQVKLHEKYLASLQK
ncbi:cysteinyl-tRNA synthetase [Rhizoclosmatium globosum]|uniref:cysteine--tRNA ligase n=1 Tax=Rhizoclosmatium globosum TaxID=329046 RepID=A0A1Y2CYP6_9FUNG|nr:cysteinyl-tRNA synthetase [Rhizoclosmatium globosum]|eukprot:ORY52006.1 cysteinyl-tRNA synthetase [Rhizoclosmatium globosum]